MRQKHVLLLVIIIMILLMYLVIHVLYYNPGQAPNLAGTSSKMGTQRIANTTVRIVIVVDNYSYNSSLKTAWGFSAYIEASGRKVLFDAGPSPEVLEYNLKMLGINVTDIDAVVISHEHYDHVGGLRYLAGKISNATIYIPAGSSPSLKNYVERLGFKPVEVSKTMGILKNIYVVGPLRGPPMEEALAVKTMKGLVILVGCSHPGVDRLVEKAVNDIGVKPYAVIGGFHMASSPHSVVKTRIDKLVSLGVKKICACHCSGDYTRKYIRENYPERSCLAGVGYTVMP